jgi:hypothetical protein
VDHTWNVWEQYLFHLHCLVTHVWILMGYQDYGEFSSVFYSLTEEGMNDEFVEESLQKGDY